MLLVGGLAESVKKKGRYSQSQSGGRGSCIETDAGRLATLRGCNADTCTKRNRQSGPVGSQFFVCIFIFIFHNYSSIAMVSSVQYIHPISGVSIQRKKLNSRRQFKVIAPSVRIK